MERSPSAPTPPHARGASQPTLPVEPQERMGMVAEESAVSRFSVDLEVYAGPFDALLSMIANRKLELT